MLNQRVGTVWPLIIGQLNAKCVWVALPWRHHCLVLLNNSLYGLYGITRAVSTTVYTKRLCKQIVAKCRQICSLTVSGCLTLSPKALGWPWDESLRRNQGRYLCEHWPISHSATCSKSAISNHQFAWLQDYLTTLLQNICHREWHKCVTSRGQKKGKENTVQICMDGHCIQCYFAVS